MRGVKNTPEQIRATWSDRYVVSDRGCHEWSGARWASGYGAIEVNYKTRRAHRVAYELFVGPIPEGMVVRHKVCDNPCCVNPAHLRVGTHADNARDRDEQGRGTSIHRSLLGPDWPIFLKRLNELGLSQDRLAVKFGVSRKIIEGALRRAPKGKMKNTRRTRSGLQVLPGRNWTIFLKRLNQLGLSQRRLAKKFGVSRNVIKRTINRHYPTT